MKKKLNLLFFLGAAYLLVACTPMYQEPVIGNIARLHFVKSDIAPTTAYKLNAQSPRWIDGYLYDNGTPISNKDTYKIEANKEFLMMVVYKFRINEYCRFDFSFVPKKDKLYHLAFSLKPPAHNSFWDWAGSSTCSLILIEDDHGKLTGVKLKKLPDNFLMW
jgi:hypothetical protein